MSLAAGTKLGPYEIQSPLGAGGMGEVYRARDTRLERTVAIKILPEEMSSDSVRKQRFEREAKTISSLNHPNICTLHDIGSQDGVDYLVMECVEGETLAKRLEKGPLPLEQVLKYGAQVADALDKAHRAGIVHRDLKPGNIMLTPTGAKLLDFGLAKPTAPLVSGATLTVAAQTTPVTQEGMIVGTFQYMSPEQVEGKELDGRSDIFSLGAVLYEMVTGKKAFEGKTQLSVASAILEKEPQPVSAVKPTSPAVLDHVVQKCLAKEPDARWQSASDIGSELRWIAESGSRGEMAAGPVPLQGRLSGLGWLATAGLLVLMGIGGAIWLTGVRQSQRTMHFASPFPLVANYVALSKDGQTVALVSYSEQKNRYMIWRYRIGEGNPAMLEGTEDATVPFWSPDGKWIGFFSQGKLKRVDAAGTSVQVLADAPNGRGGAWSKDGVILFTPDVFSGLYRTSVNGGEVTQVTKADGSNEEASHRWPNFLPDGRHFLYLSANFTGHFEKNTVYVGSLDTTDRHLVMTVSSNTVYADPGYLVYVRDGDQALVAQRFDTSSLRLSGDPQVIQNGVRYLTQIDLALFDVAGKQALVTQPGKGAAITQLKWFDRHGKALEAVGNPGSFANPNLSPDGQRLAFDETNPNGRMFGIWTRNLKTGVVSRLTLDDSLNQMPIWSPDGKRLAFSSNRNVYIQMFWKNADGSGSEEPITELGSTQETCWDWSRDGKTLLVRKEKEMWTISLPEKKAKPYHQGKGVLRNGQFSPDGKWVAYASNESGIWEVYVSPFPEANSKWQVSRGGGEEPRWRNDGKELFYISAERKMMAAEVKLGESFEARDPVELFQTRPRQRVSSQDVFTYSVSGDGQRFLLNTLVDVPNAAPLSIVLNWEAEMENQ